MDTGDDAPPELREDIGESETRLTSHPNADAAKSDFSDRLPGVYTETFEGINTGTQNPGISFGDAGTADFGETLSNQVQVLELPTGTNAGRYPISGNKYLEFFSYATVTFTEQISAFGFYGTDIGDFNGQVTLKTYSNGDLKNELAIPSTSGNENPGGTVVYFGFIDFDNSFDTVVFGNTNMDPGVDVFGFDDFTIGTLAQVVDPPPDSGSSPVPEPSTIFLVSFGVIGLGALKRRFFH